MGQEATPIFLIPVVPPRSQGSTSIPCSPRFFFQERSVLMNRGLQWIAVCPTQCGRCAECTLGHVFLIVNFQFECAPSTKQTCLNFLEKICLLIQSFPVRRLKITFPIISSLCSSVSVKCFLSSLWKVQSNDYKINCN